MDNTSNTFQREITGKVYKLYCKDENIKKIYIGSSINLDARIQKHKHNTLNENSPKHHLNVYKQIRECGNWDNWNCEVLDELKNPTRSQLIQLERMYYEENIDIATLNTTYCGRTKKETSIAWNKKNPNYWQNYRNTHTENFKKYNAKYYAENRDKINKYYNEKKQCECGVSVCRSGMDRHRKTKKHINLMKNL
mgnify:CR=1 FL=1|jgi:hypothetical protein